MNSTPTLNLAATPSKLCQYRKFLNITFPNLICWNSSDNKHPPWNVKVSVLSYRKQQNSLFINNKAQFSTVTNITDCKEPIPQLRAMDLSMLQKINEKKQKNKRKQKKNNNNNINPKKKIMVLTHFKETPESNPSCYWLGFPVSTLFFASDWQYSTPRAMYSGLIVTLPRTSLSSDCKPHQRWTNSVLGRDAWPSHWL